MKQGGVAALALAGLLLMPAAAQAASVSGDFNGDGRADLAVGIEGQKVGGHQFAGAVQVIYGSKHGLSGKGDRVFTENTRHVRQTAADFDEFGNSLAAGDFNGDGLPDLAVGAPFKRYHGDLSASGAVHILYGSRHGLRAKGGKLLVEGKGGIKGSLEASGTFGRSLAAADLGHGPQDDLAIGATYDHVGDADQAGAVEVVYGSRRGLRGTHSQRFTQNTPHVPDSAQDGDSFGWSVAAADFGRDHHADLAIGARDESVGTVDGAGSVTLLYGSRKGVRARGSRLFTENTLSSGGTAEMSDSFGWALAAANFGRGKRSDLAVGVQGRKVGAQSGAGQVNIIYGSRHGLRATGSQSFNQDNIGLADSAGVNEQFGSALAAANFGHTKHADLAIGAPSDCPGSTLCVLRAGAVDVLYGSRHGLTTAGAQYLSQETTGVNDPERMDDNFGWGVAAGRFSGGKVADLAIGAPQDDVVNADDNAGGVDVLRGSAGGITASGSQYLTQGSHGLEGIPQVGDFFGCALSGPSSGQVFD